MAECKNTGVLDFSSYQKMTRLIIIWQKPVSKCNETKNKIFFIRAKGFALETFVFFLSIVIVTSEIRLRLRLDK